MSKDARVLFDKTNRRGERHDHDANGRNEVQKEVEGGEIVSPKPVRNRLVTDDDDDDESGKSNKPVEISI